MLHILNSFLATPIECDTFKIAVAHMKKLLALSENQQHKFYQKGPPFLEDKITLGPLLTFFMIL